MKKHDYQRLQEVILQVVQTQIREGTPSETGKTFARLLKKGHGREEALNLIGHIVALEVLGVYGKGRQFDEERYVAALKKLPELPARPEE